MLDEFGPNMITWIQIKHKPSEYTIMRISRIFSEPILITASSFIAGLQ